MNQIEQLWRSQGHSDENIAKMKAVMNHPEALKHATNTGNFEQAYAMTLPKEKEQNHNLMEFFSSFASEMPEDAKSLSVALTKFSRWVQSQTDKTKPSK